MGRTPGAELADVIICHPPLNFGIGAPVGGREWAVHLLAAIFALVLVGISPAHADNRVALVIGNAAYKNAPRCTIQEMTRLTLQKR
jgi:hypothetical protein